LTEVQKNKKCDKDRPLLGRGLGRSSKQKTLPGNQRGSIFINLKFGMVNSKL
jgi:hypothetical protein